jgi:hypothetical protein
MISCFDYKICYQLHHLNQQIIDFSNLFRLCNHEIHLIDKKRNCLEWNFWLNGKVIIYHSQVNFTFYWNFRLDDVGLWKTLRGVRSEGE